MSDTTTKGDVVSGRCRRENHEDDGVVVSSVTIDVIVDQSSMQQQQLQRPPNEENSSSAGRQEDGPENYYVASIVEAFKHRMTHHWSTTDASKRYEKDPIDEIEIECRERKLRKLKNQQQQQPTKKKNHNYLKKSDDRPIQNMQKSILAADPEYSSPFLADYFRPWRFTDKYKSGTSVVMYGKMVESLQIALDVSQYEVDKIKVKPYGEAIAVEAVQTSDEVKMGTVSRSLARIYSVPSNVDLSTLSYRIENGVLYVEAKKFPMQPEHKLFQPFRRHDKTEVVL